MTGAATVALVARREITTQVRSRTFLVGLLLLGLVLGGYAAVLVLVGGAGPSSLVLDGPARELRPALDADAQRRGEPLIVTVAADPAGAEAAVRSGEADALLTGGPGSYRLVGRTDVGPGLRELVTGVVEQQAVDGALRQAGADPERVSTLAGVGIRTLEPVDPQRGQRTGIAFAVTFLLFFSVTTFGAAVAQGVVEEKSSRVVELLLATVSPSRLLAGKIIGIGLVGLLQLAVLGGLGVVVALGTGVLTVPSALPGTLAAAVLWYLLGFFLYACLYAAAAATVSRQEELQAVIGPIAVPLLAPFLLAVTVLPADPDEPWTTALSFVPFLSQTLMPARVALGAAAWWEAALAYLLGLLALAGSVLLAGRVYRNSVLRTGARVPWRDALAQERRRRTSS